MSPGRVAVIGGGVAGLAAAARFRQKGIPVVVFERAPVVGGVMQTVHRDGWTIDTGPALAAEPAAAVRELLDLAGMRELTVRADAANLNRFIVLNGTPVPLPRTTAEFSSSSLLSFGGRLRLLKERFIPARNDVAEESVDSFARRRFGDEMAERMFDPLIASTCGGDATQIIARYAFPDVVGHERGTGSSLQGSARAQMEARRRRKGRPAGSWSCPAGMHQLPAQLAAWSGDVRTSASVTRIAASSAGIELAADGLGVERFDAAVIAVPARVVGGISFELPQAGALEAVRTMPHASVAVVSLGFQLGQVARPLQGSRLLVPTIERRDVLSMVFPSIAFAGRAPAGHTLITAFVGGALRPELVELPDDELVALVVREAATLLGTAGLPLLQHVSRWRDALPQPVAGHGARLAAADTVERAEPRVAFAGAWRDGSALGEVLLGGIGAADRLLARTGGLNGPEG